MNIENINYTQFFCEENVWHLCRREEFGKLPKYVLFISNAEKKCPLWFQRGVDLFEPVWWDYHVILAVKLDTWFVFDLDSTLPFPTDLRSYFAETFPGLEDVGIRYRPGFKIIGAEEYALDFHSDRNHMKDANGRWLAAPPAWPPIENSEKLSLYDLLDFSSASRQKIYGLEEALEYFEGK